uniref:Putative secreted protein n=1 Tax=Anopheles marajoara TaxID=58244 RepID=A0A2M4CEP4_9DIPT
MHHCTLIVVVVVAAAASGTCNHPRPQDDTLPSVDVCVREAPFTDPRLGTGPTIRGWPYRWDGEDGFWQTN